MALATKSIKQRFHPSDRILCVMENFRRMTNDCMRTGIEFESKNHEKKNPSMKRLSLLCYGDLRQRYSGYSSYALYAISKAAGILSARRKSIKRGFRTRTPYLSRRLLVSSYGFKIKECNLIIHLDAETFESVPLNSHTKHLLSDATMRVRSFTLTEDSLSICVSKDVKESESVGLAGAVGVDRNLRNLAVGNGLRVANYDMTKVVDIGENTRSVSRSFRRNDARIRRRLTSKYGYRRMERIRQLLNLVSKNVVIEAKARKQAIIFEDIRGIRKLYKRGNWSGRSFRRRMNSWPFGEIKRQIQYKAAWEGVPIITLSRGETRGTTMDCPRCGERLQVPVRGDKSHYRQLWCRICEKWRDRDLVAVLNISRRGWLKFDHPQKEGEAKEAMKGNAEHDGEPPILRVDVSKLRLSKGTQ
jgi:putative transposase